MHVEKKFCENMLKRDTVHQSEIKISIISYSPLMFKSTPKPCWIVDLSLTLQPAASDYFTLWQLFSPAVRAALDDLHTLFRDRAAGRLDFFMRMRVDVSRDGNAQTIGADAEADLPRTCFDVYSLRTRAPVECSSLHTCTSDEWHPHTKHDATLHHRHAPDTPQHNSHAS